jgi:hypothetical protein
MASITCPLMGSCSMGMAISLLMFTDFLPENIFYPSPIITEQLGGGFLFFALNQ